MSVSTPGDSARWSWPCNIIDTRGMSGVKGKYYSHGGSWRTRIKYETREDFTAGKIKKS